MTVPFTPLPGLQSPWRSLNAMLQQRYEESAAMVLALIADRKSKGVPTDDLVDWRSDVGDLLDKAEAIRDREPMAALLERALAITNGGLRPLPPFVADPACEGAEVRLRALSKADVFTMRADIASVSYDGNDTAQRLRAQAAIQGAARPFLAKALVGVKARVDGGVLAEDNLSASDPRTPGVLDALDAAGLLGAVFSVAKDFQDLPVPQREVFGLPRPSISQTDSTAADAGQPSASPSGVTEGESPSTSLGTRPAKPIAAPVVTSSTSPGLGVLSISTASPEASPV